jgi:3',5'-cyclic AMP phosphodiesterase CpdA
MPIHLPPLSRRQFLGASLAGGFGLLSGDRLCGAEPQVDPDRFVLLADTHIAGNRELVARGTNMFENLRQSCREMGELATRPAGLMIAGDCAYSAGESADYAVLWESLQPLRDQGIALHLALGNHDHRQRFLEALPPDAQATDGVRDRHILKIATPRANWFVLDSLDKTLQTPGTLGQAQLDWLARTLDQATDKPALLLFHHHPDSQPKISGLTDTRGLLEIVGPRRHVKAMFFGHTHVFNVRQEDGVTLVNLPPVAYTFAPVMPNGWVDLQVRDNGATLRLNCLEPKHLMHRREIDLPWRA